MARVLVIGGSEAYNLSGEIWGKELGLFIPKTPFGEPSPIRIYEKEGIQYAYLSRHGEDYYSLSAPFVNYRANIYAAKELGVERIIAWSGPGSLSGDIHPGDMMIPHDIIDFTKQRPLTFFEKKGLGFIRQSPVFCPEIMTAMEAVFSGYEEYRGKGIYICTEGPRLETPSEIRFFRMIGGDMVGMTLVPEVFLAKELEICYSAICYISNYAEGVKEFPYKKGVLFEGTLPEEYVERVKRTISLLPSLIWQVVKNINGSERNCPCKDAMLRYRMKGVISDNWRDWINK